MAGFSDDQDQCDWCGCLVPRADLKKEPEIGPGGFYEYICEDCFLGDGAFERCPTCKGGGTVNPLTSPPGHFVAGTSDCPHCDGTGRTL